MRKGLAGLLGLATALGGLISSRAVLDVVPDKYAVALALLGTFIQAVTHPVTAVVVPKS